MAYGLGPRLEEGKAGEHGDPFFTRYKNSFLFAHELWTRIDFS
jgi:hypothetical protein